MVTTAQGLWAARLRSGPLLDLLVALAVFGGSWTLLSHDGPLPSESGGVDLVGVVLAAASTLPLVVWRRLPFAVFTVTATVGVVGATMGYGLGIMVGPVVALYLLASNRSAARPWTWASAAAVATVVVVSISVTVASHQGLQATELVHAALPWAVAWFAGDRTRLRRDQIGELRDRARRAERELEQERLLAAAEERVRIARDLHDSAGHAINVIAVRAGAARLRHHQDPDRSLRALEEIEETARETIEEIDHMVATLRSGNSANGEVEAPIGLTSLDTLIDRHTMAGLKLTVETSGYPKPLVTAADQAAYRILQEALTNAARHGTGMAHIQLSFLDTALEASVTNPVPEAGSTATGGGHGLIGMRERAALVGGSLDTGRVDGSFQVQATIPYGDHG